MSTPTPATHEEAEVLQSGIFPLNAQERANYISALRSIHPETDGMRFPTTITVDRRGHSQEVADALGDPCYLRNASIFVNPSHQLDDRARPILEPDGFPLPESSYGANAAHDASIKQLLAKDTIARERMEQIINRAGSLICVVTSGDDGPLSSKEMDDFGFFSLYAADDSVAEQKKEDTTETTAPSTTKGFTFAMDTTDRDAKKGRDLVKEIDHLDQDVDLIFHTRRLRDLRYNYNRGFRIFGNLARADLELSLTEEIPSDMLLENRDHEIFFLPSNSGNTTIGFSKNDQYEQLADIFRGSKGRILGNDVNAILDALFTSGRIIYDTVRGAQRMDRIEEGVMVQFGHFKAVHKDFWGKEFGETDEIRALKNMTLKGFARYKAFRSYRKGYHGDYFKKLLSDDWDKLRDVLYDKKSPSILPAELRVNLIYSADPKDIITRGVLARITPDDQEERFLYFKRGFHADFTTADEPKKKAMYSRIKFLSEEYPVQTATWLAENSEC